MSQYQGDNFSNAESSEILSPALEGDGNAEYEETNQEWEMDYITDQCNLIINYLPHDVDDNSLKNIFSEHGEITMAKVVKDKNTKKSLGYGFVKFLKINDACDAIQSKNGFCIGHKKLKVSVARPPSDDIRNCKLYITNLPKEYSEREVYELFSQFGEIIECRVLKDRNAKANKGVSFVQFGLKSQANNALALNGFRPGCSDRSLVVKYAEDQHRKKEYRRIIGSGVLDGIGINNVMISENIMMYNNHSHMKGLSMPMPMSLSPHHSMNNNMIQHQNVITDDHNYYFASNRLNNGLSGAPLHLQLIHHPGAMSPYMTSNQHSILYHQHISSSMQPIMQSRNKNNNKIHNNIMSSGGAHSNYHNHMHTRNISRGGHHSGGLGNHRHHAHHHHNNDHHIAGLDWIDPSQLGHQHHSVSHFDPRNTPPLSPTDDHNESLSSSNEQQQHGHGLSYEQFVVEVGPTMYPPRDHSQQDEMDQQAQSVQIRELPSLYSEPTSPTGNPADPSYPGSVTMEILNLPLHADVALLHELVAPYARILSAQIHVIDKDSSDDYQGGRRRGLCSGKGHVQVAEMAQAKYATQALHGAVLFDGAPPLQVTISYNTISSSPTQSYHPSAASKEASSSTVQLDTV